MEKHVARTTYYEHLEKAMLLFEQVLIELHSPALHLESQAQPPLIAGRTAELHRCSAALRRPGAVAICGPSGIGKTVLAAAAAARLAPRPVFWYTFRPGLNDRLEHLLFALAYFMQQHDAPELWMQLVADRGQVKPAVVEGMLRHELKVLADLSPVLCFDEVDLLDPGREAHAALLGLLETLAADAAVLLVGQKLPRETLPTIELGELDAAATRALLTDAEIEITDEELLHVGELTRGNPRLIKLFVALHAAGEPLSSVLAQFTRAPTLEGMLNRIWERLKPNERRILLDLSVYRSPVPSGVWAKQQGMLDKLVARQLVQDDGRGGLSLLPVYRDVIYADASPEVRAQLHLAAAQVRADLGERTAAAYHCLRADRTDLALNLWYPHRQSEINQGQGGAAHALFDEVALGRLPPQQQQLLALIRGELGVLRGEYKAAADLLEEKAVWGEDVLSVRRSRLRGDIAEATGDLDTARLAYLEGLGMAENLHSREIIRLRLDLGWVDRRQANFSRAWQETQIAEYETEDLRGDILRDQGQFAAAKVHYDRAIALARETGNLGGLANTHNALAAMLAQQGDYAAADAQWEIAFGCVKQIGKLTRLPTVRVNQATNFMLAGQYEQAVAYAQEALGAFETFAETFGIAVAANTLAESYLGLRQLDVAEQYVARVFATKESSVIPDTLRIQAEIVLRKQGPAAALPICRRSIKAAAAIRDFYIEGQSWRLMGRLHHARRRHDRAAAAFQRAVAIFTDLELANERQRTQDLWEELYGPKRQHAALPG